MSNQNPVSPILPTLDNDVILNGMADSTTWSKAVLVQTQEEERYRLARALQNGPAQLFANAVLELETSLRLLEVDPQAAREGLTALLTEMRQGLVEVRDLITDLQPPLLSELGLATSLKKHVDDFCRRTAITATFSGWDDLTDRLPATMEMAIFRIIQEALENVRAHSRATQVQILLHRTPDKLVVTVIDNGQGFNAEDSINPSARRLGLVAMRDRAELIGGQLKLFSEPSRGVGVVLTVPLRGRAAPNPPHVESEK